MSVARTPPGLEPMMAEKENRLRECYRSWRRTLHRAKDYRVKVLRTLADDGNGEAAEILKDPPRAYKATRCQNCAGCALLAREKGCGSCQGCQKSKGCEEHHRRCREWPRSAHAHHAGSVITAVSSQFDLVAADLTNYENVVVALREIDLEMEEASDDLPSRLAS